MTSAIDKGDFDFENAKYRPDISFPTTTPQIRADWIENYMKNNTLGGRAVLVSSDSTHSVYVVDTYVKVKIPSESFRDAKVKHWEEQHYTAKKWAWIEGGCAVLLAVGAFALQATPPVAAGLAVASVASLIFCGINASKTSETSRQIEGWKASPLEKIASERAKAYREGFPYVYRNDLKLQGSSHTQVLLPYEVQFLFEKYFDGFYTNLLPQHPASEQEKKEWLDHFTHYNPVAGPVLRYAYDGAVPEKYVKVSYDYEILYKQLTDLRGEFTKLRHERREETNKVIQGINRNRDLALLPFQAMLTYWEMQARTERDARLAKTTDIHEIERIRDEYFATIHKYHVYHAAAVIPVNLVFDNQVSNAKANLRSILEEIKKNEASSHAPYFNYAWGLLDYARQVKQQPTFVYVPQAFTPAQVFNIPAPSAPPVVTINFIQEARQQKPAGIEESSYADYLKFVSWEQQRQNGRPLYPNLGAGG